MRDYLKKKILSPFRWQKLISEDKLLGEVPANRTIAKRAFNIAWPSAVESVLIALIGAIDMMMVGGLGRNAVSAIGITTQPKFLILATILSLNVGLTVLVSRRKGEGKSEDANRYLRQCLLVSILLSFILSSIGYFFAENILLFAGANADYIHLAVDYFKIIMIGGFFFSIGLTITAAQRGAGNTKISMKTNLIANLFNLVFNALLIHGLFFFPALGVKGAAIATLIGNVAALLIAIYSITKKDGFLKLTFKESWRLDKKTMGDVFKITKATFVEQMFLRLGFLLYSRTIAGLGTVAFSAHQVCMNVMHITFACGDGLQIATTSLVGQNLGAKRADMAMIYSKLAQRVGLTVGIIMFLLISIFKDPLMLMFIQDSAVIAMGQIPMIFLSVTVMFQIPQVITVGSLRGAGDVKFIACMMLVSVAVFRPILAWLFAYQMGMGLNGAWLALFLDQITRYMLSKWRFKQAKWMKIIV